MAKSQGNTDFSSKISDPNALAKANALAAERNRLNEENNSILQTNAQLEEKIANYKKKDGAWAKKRQKQIQDNTKAIKENNEESKKAGKLQQQLVSSAKLLHKTSEAVADNAERQLDSWASLSSVYSHTKETLNDIAFSTIKISQVGASISGNLNLDLQTQTAALSRIEDMSDGFSTISTKSAELASLSAEDFEKRKLIEDKIGREIDKIKEKRDWLVQNAQLGADEIKILDDSIANKETELTLAKEIASQSKIQKEIQEELKENAEGIHKAFSKAYYAVKFLFSGLRGAASVTLFVAGEIADEFGKINKELGVGMGQMKGFKTQIGLATLLLGEGAGEAVKELGKELGDTNHVSNRLAENAAMLAANYGLGGEQAAFMATAFGELQGQSEKTGLNTQQYVKDLSLANGVAPAQVMKDIAENTEFMAIYSKDGGKNIGEAAVAAAKLGIGLQTASKMADHLLDYQNSVTDEMEASVLLGRDINLSKARELAYNGDIAGSLKEGLEAVGGIAAYNEMDPYQRQATAKALGVSNAELQKMVSHQESLEGMNGVVAQQYSVWSDRIDAFNNSYLGKTLKGMGGLILGAGEYKRALDSLGIPVGGIWKKMKGWAFAGWDWVKSLGIGKALSAAIEKAKGLGSAIKGAFGFGAKQSPVEMYQSLRDKGIGATDALKQSGATAGDVLKAKKGGVTESIADKAKDKLTPEAVTGKADEAGKGGGEGIKEKLKNVAEGLKAMGQSGVTKGALNLIPAGIGFMAILPGIPAMYLLSKMDLSNLGNGLAETAIALGFLGNGQVTKGALNLIVAGLGFTALLPGLFSMYFLSKMDLSRVGVGLTELAVGLQAMAGTYAGAGALALAGAAFTLMIPAIPALLFMATMGEAAAVGIDAFGIAVAGLAAAAPEMAIGALAIAMVGTAMIPFYYALSLLAPLVTSVGNAISTIITSMSNAFVTILDSLKTADLGQLALFGLALIPVALGLSIFGALSPLIILGVMALMGLGLALQLLAPNISLMSSVMPQLVENLQPLVSMILPIFGLAGAITALGFSLAVLGTMGILALPVLAALGTLGAVAGAIGIGGGGGGGGEDKQDQMIQLLKSIDSKVGNTKVNLDGKQVSTALNVNNKRQGAS